MLNKREACSPPHTIHKRKQSQRVINEAVIKMIIKGRSLTMRHVSRTHRVGLDWLFDRLNLDSKIQIKQIDTKNQLADILTKGNFTRDEWNHLLCLFNVSHFSSTVCSEAMAKRTQQDLGEERVTAKSRPMISLIARAPSTLSSSASESPGKKSYGSQSPWSAKAEKDDRTGQPVVDRHASHESVHHHKQFVESSYSARYSGWDDDKAWSSQEWKSDELMDDRTGRPVVCPQGGAQHFVIEDDKTELELSLGSRSFLHSVNDQVRERQKQSSMNVTEDRKMFCDLENVHGFNIAIICIHGEELFKQLAFRQEYKRSLNETNVQHIYKIGVRTRLDLWSEKIDWENPSWKYLSLIGDEQVISHQRTNVFVFSDFVLCLGNILENRHSNDGWEQRLGWIQFRTVQQNPKSSLWTMD